MNLEERIAAFSELGLTLRNALEGRYGNLVSEFETIIGKQQQLNGWFTPENVRMAISSIAEKLNYENLLRWTNRYPALGETHEPFVTAVIMAGNIPLVGFHDFLSVLMSGNKILVKSSSKDSDLIKYIAGILCQISPDYGKYISFAEEKLTGFDAVIATGSDNSSRYFEYYFGKYPHIIRKNRNSVAVLKGDEDHDDMSRLGRDVFSYFGLGCRNVSKLYLPAGYNVDMIPEGWSGFSGIINHSKYANNYEYNMAVWLVNKEKFLDTGYVLLKESGSISSPIATLYYEYYFSPEELSLHLDESAEKIQCIAGKDHSMFGSLQSPELWDYSDNIDTLDFLLKKNMPEIS